MIEQARPANRSDVAAGTLVTTLRFRDFPGDSVTQPNLQLNPTAGEKLRSMLAAEIEQVDAWLQRSNDLARRAPLGKNPVGEAMAAKFGNRADGDAESLAGVLKPYRQVLQDAHGAVIEAMKLYQSTEQRVVASLRKAAKEQA
jgi:hypothetical protein